MQRRATGPVSRLLTLDLPRVASGILVEAGWVAAHLVTVPMGPVIPAPRIDVRRHALDGLSPEQRGLIHHDVDAAETPILLVHGIVDNHSIFTLLDRALRRRGFLTVSTYDYGLLTRDIPAAAELLGEAVEKLATSTGHERVHVIGHSLGGLMARYYVQRLGGDTRVHTLVTLGTPHHGTRLAHLMRRVPLVGQLTPQSPVIRELAGPAPDCRTRFLAFYSDIDHVIWPTRNARIDHPDLRATNVEIRGVGHLSMPSNSRIAYAIAKALRELDPFDTTTGENSA